MEQSGTRGLMTSARRRGVGFVRPAPCLPWPCTHSCTPDPSGRLPEVPSYAALCCPCHTRSLLRPCSRTDKRKESTCRHAGTRTDTPASKRTVLSGRASLPRAHGRFQISFFLCEKESALSHCMDITRDSLALCDVLAALQESKNELRGVMASLLPTSGTTGKVQARVGGESLSACGVTRPLCKPTMI